MIPFIIMCLCMFYFGFAFYALLKDFINDGKENEKEDGNGHNNR